MTMDEEPSEADTALSAVESSVRRACGRRVALNRFHSSATTMPDATARELCTASTNLDSWSPTPHPIACRSRTRSSAQRAC